VTQTPLFFILFAFSVTRVTHVNYEDLAVMSNVFKIGSLSRVTKDSKAMELQIVSQIDVLDERKKKGSKM
jgi:hypothetical protein